jgi:hypothetical protein
MMHIENFFGGPLFEFNVDLCADVCFYPRDDCLSASVCTRALYVYGCRWPGFHFVRTA